MEHQCSHKNPQILGSIHQGHYNVYIKLESSYIAALRSHGIMEPEGDPRGDVWIVGPLPQDQPRQVVHFLARVHAKRLGLRTETLPGVQV